MHDERARRERRPTPSSRTISSAVDALGCARGGRRARSVRSRSSSQAPSVGVLAIVGHDVGSIRSITPAASRRRNRSSSDSAVGGRRHRVGGQPEGHDRVGLDDGAVEHPRIARADPDDPVGSTPLASSHTIAVGGGLPRADDHEARSAPSPSAAELVDRRRRATPSATPNGGGVVAGIVGDEVGGVDDPTAHVDLHGLARHPRRDEVVAPSARCSLPAEERDPARCRRSGGAGCRRSRPGSPPGGPVPAARPPGRCCCTAPVPSTVDATP